MTNNENRIQTVANESTGRRRRVRGLGVLGGAAAALAVWAVAVPLAGVDLAIERGGSVQEVGPGAVVVSALLAGLAGWGLLALLERGGGDGRRPWTAIACGFLALSLLGPLTSAAGAASAVVLCAMHLVVAGVVVPALRR